MVPTEFGDFFLGTAGVAGALIGLLFVAVSVRPEAAARSAQAAERERPIVALSALLNVLTLSLLALIPGVNLGSVAIWLGVVGLASMAAVIVLLIADLRKSAKRRPSFIVTAGGIVLLIGQTVAYAFQVGSGFALQNAPADSAPVTTQALIAVALVVVAVTRAWEFIGADRAGLTTTIIRLLFGRSKGETKPSAGAATEAMPTDEAPDKEKPDNEQ